MANRIPDEDLAAIEDAVRRHSGSVTLQQIANSLKNSLPRRTLQYRLRYLVNAKRLVADGEGRWTKYRLPPEEKRGEAADPESQIVVSLPLSKTSNEIQDYPSAARDTQTNRL